MIACGMWQWLIICVVFDCLYGNLFVFTVLLMTEPRIHFCMYHLQSVSSVFCCRESSLLVINNKEWHSHILSIILDFLILHWGYLHQVNCYLMMKVGHQQILYRILLSG